MKLSTKIASIFLSGGLLFSMSPAALASGMPLESVSVNSSNQELTTQEMEQFERDIEKLFTRYVVENSNGIFEVKYDNVHTDGAEDALQHFENLAYALNLGASSPEVSTGVSQFSTLGSVVQPLGVGEFAWCVLYNGLGGNIIVNAPGLIEATKVAIRAWNWGLAATTVARIIGPVAVKSLGGPWGIAASLALAAPGCARHL